MAVWSWKGQENDGMLYAREGKTSYHSRLYLRSLQTSFDCIIEGCCRRPEQMEVTRNCLDNKPLAR